MATGYVELSDLEPITSRVKLVSHECIKADHLALNSRFENMKIMTQSQFLSHIAHIVSNLREFITSVSLGSSRRYQSFSIKIDVDEFKSHIHAAIMNILKENKSLLKCRFVEKSNLITVRIKNKNTTVYNNHLRAYFVYLTQPNKIGIAPPEYKTKLEAYFLLRNLAIMYDKYGYKFNIEKGPCNGYTITCVNI